MNFTTRTDAPATPQPKAAASKQNFRVQKDAHSGTSVTLAQVSANAEAGDVFGLTRPEGSGRKGFAMKRVLRSDGTFGAVNGGDLVAEWTDAQLARLVYVGKSVAAAAKPQRTPARAKSRARKASKRTSATPKAAPKERTAAQHEATLRMLSAKYPERANAYAAKHNLTTVS